MRVPKVKVRINKRNPEAQRAVLGAYVVDTDSEGEVRGVNLLSGRSITNPETAQDEVRRILADKADIIEFLP